MSEPEEAADAALAPGPARAPRRGRTGEVVLWGAVVGLLLALGTEVIHVVVGQNFHTVLPGRVYRCAQLTGPELEERVDALGIRTVLNLRGCCDPYPWYLEETRSTHHLDIAQEDICLSACRLPSAHEVRRLVEVLDRCEYPILLHCRRGADRTGLVSALCVLLQTNASLRQAHWQLGPRFGHFALGKPKYLDHFLELYAEWLQSQGQPHSQPLLRRWLEQEYCPAECRCELTPIEVPATVPQGQPLAMHIRVKNTSIKPWRFCPGSASGIHAGYILADRWGHCLTAGRAGLFDAEVAPGESIDLTLAVPGIELPGAYSLMVDMVDEQQCWFFQGGSEPFQGGVIVTEH